jgi:hypothetical protein
MSPLSVAELEMDLGLVHLRIIEMIFDVFFRVVKILLGPSWPFSCSVVLAVCTRSKSHQLLLKCGTRIRRYLS